jgi:2-dehydro-3-deoxy-D-pentonate aldolase
VPLGLLMNVPAKQKKHWGVVVPMVSPITPQLALDESAIERIVQHLRDGGVHGVFVLGTTGEGPAVPQPMRDRLVELVTQHANGQLRVYAGISSDSIPDSVAAGERYLKFGVDAVIAHAPARSETNESLHYFAELASRLNGDLIIYNMPLTTNVSLPIEVCKETARRPSVRGIKDSENNVERLGLLLRELRDRESFSVFVGTSPLMAKGLLQGADGIVPSAGNLAPTLCRRFFDSIAKGDLGKTELLHKQLMDTANLFQKGRTLEQSIATLKGAMSLMGFCGADVFPPLKKLTATEQAALETEMSQCGLVRDSNMNAPLRDQGVSPLVSSF